VHFGKLMLNQNRIVYLKIRKEIEEIEITVTETKEILDTLSDEEKNEIIKLEKDLIKLNESN
jgi:hypothetical protein